MTGQQLKNSILQMAVQGKLVPQDPNDESASVLLERIRKEKEQLIKEGKIKKEKNPSYIFRGADNLPYEKVGKNEPVCIADKVPFEIPESWEWVRLRTIAVTKLGKTLNKTKNQGCYKPYLCSINVYWNGIDLSTIKEARFEESELSKYKLRKGDLLICEGGDVGRSAIWEDKQEMYYQNALHRVRFYGGINPYYFRLLIECYKRNKILDECSKGMTIKHLVQSALNAICFPLPPIQEQQRIIDKFKLLLPLLERYNAIEEKLSSLNTQFPNLLKKSILQEAVQGKLVPQDPSDEPASVLLEHIREEKERLIQEGKIKRDKHESIIFRRDNSHYEKLDGVERCIDDEIPFEIPETWCFCRLGTILYKLTDGTHSRPKYVEAGVPFISVKDVSSGMLDFSNCKFITEIEHKELYKRCNPEYGDILLTKVGTTGIPIIVNTTDEFSLFVSVALLKFNQKLMNNEYLVYLINSPLVQKQAEENTRGVGNKNWVMRDISNTLIVIPPLKEQYRIVEKLKNTFNIYNNL